MTEPASIHAEHGAKGAARLFAAAVLLGGACALGGSIAGHAFGSTGILVGGMLGGILGATTATTLARWRAWIAPRGYARATFGAITGFLLATAIAVKTLRSPVGPIASTLLIGAGAVLGARSAARR